MTFLRLIVFGFVALSLVYGILFWAERVRVRRGVLEDWEEQGRPGQRKEFVRRGMNDYEHSLARKLLLAVFIIPVAVVVAIIYGVNYM